MLDPPILTFTGICCVFILPLLTYYYIFFASSTFNIFNCMLMNVAKEKKVLAFKNTNMEKT